MQCEIPGGLDEVGRNASGVGLTVFLIIWYFFIVDKFIAVAFYTNGQNEHHTFCHFQSLVIIMWFLFKMICSFLTSEIHINSN